jgi:hypothetical protein
VRLIVLHTAEGATTYQSLGAYFQSPSAGVSSHVGIDDTPGTVGEYVQPSGKAWTAANANPVAVQAELCAFAQWSAAEWDRHGAMLANTAQWIAEESARFGIPIVRLTPAQAQGSGRGVCQHVDLGAWGGSHWDCGPAFPMARVLELAKGGGTVPPPPTEVFELGALVQFIDGNGITTYCGVADDGGLLEYKADGHRNGTPANREGKTWSAYNLTANAAGAKDKRFAK